MLLDQPSYLALAERGELTSRVSHFQEILAACTLCPHQCGVDRVAGQRGFCQGGALARISGYGPHYGEESVLVGTGGSGTVFFCHCNLRCVFCQNYETSHFGWGEKVSPEQLAEVMLSLQKKGCDNINLVSPSHYVAQIVEALAVAVARGLRLPIVYNTGAYDDVATLKMLDGIVDIYMPDLKFGDNALALRYTGVSNYVDVAQAAIEEMARQVGRLTVNEHGLATRGLLVRHLVLPQNASNTEQVLRFIAHSLPKGTALNLMSQYYPAHRAFEYPALSSRLSRAEFQKALDLATALGLTNLH